jgi:hypothetical protein
MSSGEQTTLGSDALCGSIWKKPRGSNPIAPSKAFIIAPAGRFNGSGHSEGRNQTMPFTPYHFGPHACVALPLGRYIDVPVFIGANVIVDIEPLYVMLFKPDYPLHGYCHTFVIGGLLGVLWAGCAYPFRHLIGRAMSVVRLPYSPTFVKMAISGVLGIWMHVLFDAPLYSDIRPFFPLAANPLFGIVSMRAVYTTCELCFLPALLIYALLAFRRPRRTP